MAPMFSIITSVNITIEKIINLKSCFGVFPSIRRSKNSKSHVFWGPIIAMILLFISAQSGVATTIIVLRTPTWIMLGSDSGIRHRLHGQDTLVPECKIKQLSGVFFTATGYYRPAPLFNPYDFAEKAARNGGGVVAIANRFERIAIQPFKASLPAFRLAYPEVFEKSCRNLDCLQVVFVSVENGVPKVAARNFLVTTPHGRILVTPDNHKDCPGDCELGDGWGGRLGMHEEADAILNRSPDFWQVRGPVRGIDELIREEIRAKPKDVALPVSILVIDKTGPHWALGYQGVCPDIVRH